MRFPGVKSGGSKKCTLRSIVQITNILSAINNVHPLAFNDNAYIGLEHPKRVCDMDEV